MFQLVQAQDGPGRQVNRDLGVICCLNGNEGCFREDITVILACVMVRRSESGHYFLPLLSLVASLGDGY